MNINIDTDKLLKWSKEHLKIVVTLGFWFMAWFCAKQGIVSNTGPDCFDMAVFYGACSVIFLVLSVILTMCNLGAIFGWKLK